MTAAPAGPVPGPVAGVEAVIVNHNTSRFAEIAVRSLHLAASAAPVPVRITVVDNHSTDDTGPLRAALRQCGARWEPSRWPAGRHGLNTHGDVLRDFVLARPDAPAFLIADSDICFFDPAVLAVMCAELAEDAAVWAVGARLLTEQVATGAGSFGDAVRHRRRYVALTARMDVQTDDGSVSTVDLEHQARRLPRCHPGCALIRNGRPFQQAVRHLGLSAAWVWANDPQLGGLRDTLSMVSGAMRTHELHSRISAAPVLHFGHGTQVGLTARQESLLARLRAGQDAEFAAGARAALGLPA
jgi:hypothetical protein